MEEIWKDIPGYEGEYQVSSLGRVKSLSRRVQVAGCWRRRASTKGVPERILRPGRNKSGHLSVVLRHGANGSQVHQLVMLTFVGPCPPGMEVCHNDGDPTNNRLENLRYDTRKANILDARRVGVNPLGKLKPDEVREIRKLLALGEKGSTISRRYGVSQSAISDIKLGRTYAWVD